MTMQPDPQVVLKTPRETKPIDFDFGANGDLPSGDTISSKTVDGGGLTVASSSISSLVVQAMLSGGSAGVEYRVIVKATAASGRVAEIVCYVRVIEP